jgi:hypothetical protein
MSETIQPYTPTVNLLNLFLNPAQGVAFDTTERRDRFPSRYRTQIAHDLINTIESDPTLFQMKQFCQRKGITVDELEIMAKENTTLRRALVFAKECFESRLVEMGFTSQKATMAIFALKNQHDYRDRQASDEHRASITVNLHLPQRDGAVMAKYEVIEEEPVKKSRRGGKKALAQGVEIAPETAVVAE